MVLDEHKSTINKRSCCRSFQT